MEAWTTCEAMEEQTVRRAGGVLRWAAHWMSVSPLLCSRHGMERLKVEEQAGAAALP